MELLGQTLILYLAIGIGVAGALFLGESSGRRLESWFRVTSAVFFWPIFLPILLTRPRAQVEETPPSPPAVPDELVAAIAQVDAELLAALKNLDGWAENVLAREKDRFRELRAAWTVQAARIREMDRVLAIPEHADSRAATNEAEFTDVAELRPEVANDRVWSSQVARRKNIERLKEVRKRAYDNLMATLAWVRELVSMIHLAKFTGAPEARAEELVAQIASAVEGLSEVTWQEETVGAAP
jgi:hypothetical protein